MAAPKAYIPALGWNLLTPLYDTLTRIFAREATLKPALVARATIADGERVLDLGCGTGTLALLIRRQVPAARVVGLDRDPGVLAITQRKIARAGEPIPLVLGSSVRLPFADGAFDRVLVSLVFHHLATDEKARTLAEVARVLRPERELFVMDWERPHNALMALVTVPMTWFEPTARVAPHVRGEFPDTVRAAGFADVEVCERYMTPFGTAGLLRARKDATPEIDVPRGSVT